jgi:putative transposase
MPRANRYFLPGHVWHITHRCHKKEFLLRFAKDRKRWLRWLFEAKKRYGLCILNYMVTSNHIHLLVKDTGNQAIARSMQLVAGRLAQEFNQRKQRKGAFWEDRYHATAVEAGDHLARCLVYIDLNMVRAGAVEHPLDWETSGYAELFSARQRYGLTDRYTLMALLGMDDLMQLREERSAWFKESLKGSVLKRDEQWTESLAVGNRSFVEEIKSKLEIGRRGTRVLPGEDGYVLREEEVDYRAFFKG